MMVSVKKRSYIVNSRVMLVPLLAPHVSRIARTGPTLILVTHHLKEIVPEITRVILLRRGRVAFDGPKEATLTSTHLSHVFEAPVAVGRQGGYYSAAVPTEDEEDRGRR